MRCRSLKRTALAALTALLLAGAPAHGQTSTPETSSLAPAPSAPSSLDIPFAGISADISAIREDIDAATARALQLESEISALDADDRALQERLAVTTARIVEQRAAVYAAEERFTQAERRYRGRLVEVYKRGSFDPFSLLLSADTLSDLVSRAAVLTRIAESDSRVVSDLNVAAADARYQQAALAELQAQDRALKRAHEERRDALTALLAEQDALVAQLTAEAREKLLQARRFNAATRQQWRSSSIPTGASIPRATATVDSHPGVEYVIPAYMPRQYRTTGQTFTAVCSWYGPGFNGRGTASGQTFNEDDLTCASKTLPFGTVLALTRGDRRVIVYVNDRGPYIAGRDIDLSKAAAGVLGIGGVSSVTAEIVLPVP
ncbi:MAG: septal ring lytic transglycosylase RlpA family protein [Coriobacteriia bacterium]|nr:septal ring lytic transglycosylase RlpA family protein [Coriobacteriia bacterium]